MTESHGISPITLDPPSSAELTPETASHTPILITEPEVAFSTAAAVPVQASATRRWIGAARDAVAMVAHRIFQTTPEARRNYWDYSVMAREIHRL